MQKTAKKSRIATYLDGDLLKWIIEQARKLRISESTFIRQLIAKEMGKSK